MHTALDILKLNSADPLSAVIEGNKTVAPELSVIPGFTIAGTTYPTAVRTSVPEGDFSALGGGVAIGKSTYENKMVQCFSYSNPLREMLDVAKAHRRGVAAHLANAVAAAMKGAMQKIGRQFYYGVGTNGSASGFPGLLATVSSDMVVDATGTTPGTGSSVWFVKLGNMEDGNVSFVFGNDVGLSLTDWVMQQITTEGSGDSQKVAMAYVAALAANVGVQCIDPKAVGRIRKLTAESGKGLTDTLGYQLLEKFPAGQVPDFAFMTRRSVAQLRQSRTSDNGGASQTAWPTEIAGIRIIETDSISNTEALSL